MHDGMPAAHRATVDRWQYGPPRRGVAANQAPVTPTSVGRVAPPACEHRPRSPRLRAWCLAWRRGAAELAAAAAAVAPLVAAPAVATRAVAATALLEAARAVDGLVAA